MKVAIEILSTNSEPSTSNIVAMKETFVKLANESSLEHDYDFYFYYGGYDASKLGTAVVIKEDDVKNCYNVKVSCQDTIYNTFEKGIWALKYVKGYDWYIRINISCYLNILLLDKVLNQFNNDTVYCNAINTYINDENYYNDIYPRGDMMIFSEKTRQGILSNCEKYIRCDINNKDRLNIPHVDDCLFGLCLIDYFGKDYFEHLLMLKYNYLPEPKENLGNTVSLFCIGNRVKTNPPGVSYSGYSWDDNEYRRFDGKKMKYINNIIKQSNYMSNIKLEDLLSNERPTLFISLSSQNINTIKQYLKNKKRKL